MPNDLQVLDELFELEQLEQVACKAVADLLRRESRRKAKVAADAVREWQDRCRQSGFGVPTRWWDVYGAQF